MNQVEGDRYRIIQDVIGKQISQQQAAKLLRISTRQLRTLQRRIETEGMEGAISKRFGQPSNRKYSEACERLILEKASGIFKNWGPTLIAEKLRETDGTSVSSEYVRKLLITHNLWHSRTRKLRQHLPRDRRECFGELIQGDGSKHHWFGKDRPPCTLIVMIDDATSIVTALYFAPEETTEAYFYALQMHIRQWGVPRGFYSDRHSIFGGTCRDDNTSQFERALIELGIEPILAHSPQAKGRVERVNRTFQDRLVKEFDYNNIATIEEANKFLLSYTPKHNARFGKAPKSKYDAHRAADTYDLDWILAHREERKIDRQLTFQYHNEFYVIEGISTPNRCIGKPVSIKDLGLRAKSGPGIEVRLDGVLVKVKKLNNTTLKMDSKIINIKEHKYSHQKNTHPFKKAVHMKTVTDDVLKTNWGYN